MNLLFRSSICIASLAVITPCSAFLPSGVKATHNISTTPSLVANTLNSLATARNNIRANLSLRMGLFDMLTGGGGDAGLISPEQALPGRQQKMANIDGYKHYITGKDVQEVPDGFEVAVFANGCFWGSEKGIWHFPEGIHSTAVGYCGGFTPNPTYEEACSGRSGHTEGVRVVFDPSKVAFTDILRWFWEAHDPCSGMGQGNDRGTQYRSGFYYFNDDQKRLIEASKEAYEKQLGKTITTEIASADDYEKYGGVWFFGEVYHQQYLAKPGARPYCSAKPQGVSVAPFEEWAPKDLAEKYKPTLPEGFWKAHAPQKGCSVVNSPNEPIKVGEW
jgi:peptide-methionine (S)-S-oxide reductase